MTNPIKRMFLGASSFVIGLIGVYIGYSLMDNMISALTESTGINEPIMTGIAWLAFIILAIVAVIGIPLYEFFSMEQETG